MKEGYCSYDLDTKAYVDLERKKADLVYRLSKGELCRFGKTSIIEKPEGISDEVILSRMRYREGDPFTTERINESYSALNRLGIFGRTVIDTEKKFFNVIPPEISTRLKEKMHLFNVALGFDSRVGARVRATYDQYNFFGGGRKIGLEAQYSTDIKKLTANFLQPVLFSISDRYFDFYADGGYYEEAYDDYDEKKAYLDLKIGHEEGCWSYDLGMTAERIEITIDGERRDGIIPGNFNIIHPYLNIVYDTRDSHINPRKGYYLSAYLEPGYSRGEKDGSHYYKFLLEGHYIRSFGQMIFAGVGHF